VPPPPHVRSLQLRLVRLVKHSLAALVLFEGLVLAPLLLLLRHLLGTAATVLGVGFLAVCSACLLGATLSQSVDGGACAVLRWRCVLAATWLLNPVLMIVVGKGFGCPEVMWGSAIPLAVAIAALSGRWQSPSALRARLQLGRRQEEGSTGQQQGRATLALRMAVLPLLALRWFVQRAVVFGFLMGLLSFQIVIYLPDEVLHLGNAVGLVACGGCALMSTKLYATCACLGRQRFAPAVLTALLMAADWISCLDMMEILPENMKPTMLLTILFAAGVIQLYLALTRLKLRIRWAHLRVQWRAASAMTAGDVELGLPMARRADSSDSDDERGPGSLPDGFHGALAGLLCLPPASSQLGPREFLCGPRCAFITGESGGDENVGDNAQVAMQAAPLDSGLATSASLAATGTPATAQQAPCGGITDDQAVLPLEILPGEQLCVVCQEEIQMGEHVRPLPRCSHKFHARCLERWALAMREATRCPTCRRPALARKQGSDGTSLSALASSHNAGADGASSSGAGQGGRANGFSRNTVGMRSHMRAARPRLNALRGGTNPWNAELYTSTTSSSSAIGVVPTGRNRTRDFEVKVDKDGEELGLDVLHEDNETLLISRIKDGPLLSWNTSHPDCCVQQGDRIVEVNGKRGSSELLIATIRGERALQLTVRRLLEFVVVVQRPTNGNARLGLDVMQYERSLRIEQVGDGPFRCWNDRAGLDRQVRASDFIVEVNGVRGTSNELLQAIHNDTCLQLQLLLCRGHGHTFFVSQATTPDFDLPTDGNTSDSETDEEADDSDDGFMGDLPLPAAALPPQPRLQSDGGGAAGDLENHNRRTAPAEVVEASETAEIGSR